MGKLLGLDVRVACDPGIREDLLVHVEQMAFYIYVERDLAVDQQYTRFSKYPTTSAALVPNLIFRRREMKRSIIYNKYIR